MPFGNTGNIEFPDSAFDAFGRRFEKPHYSEFQVKDSLSSLKAEAIRHDEEQEARKAKPDIAEANASAQIGEIAIYLKNNFPIQFSTGKPISQIVIGLLDRAYGDLL